MITIGTVGDVGSICAPSIAMIASWTISVGSWIASARRRGGVAKLTEEYQRQQGSGGRVSRVFVWG